MLLQLSIHHLALINDMTIDFEPGMNVMTGETGAGKSIVCLLYTSPSPRD